jgi:hypothetical protein
MSDVINVKRLHDETCDLVYGVGFTDKTSCLLIFSVLSSA